MGVFDWIGEPMNAEESKRFSEELIRAAKKRPELTWWDWFLVRLGFTRKGVQRIRRRRRRKK